ncbi:MAG: hypothetical protein HUJ26_02925 [Planctomycetaceae bacterium]|nr:hypothetical protein [Planctomycetaceae bacterium]
MDHSEQNNQDHAADDQALEGQGGDNGEIYIPQTPDPLSNDSEELQRFVYERDDAIQQLRLRNEELQQKLSQREKMVTALTSRLEQAAEQLDRLRRSGADRGGKLLAGIPSEVIDEQRELINDLKAAIQHWEDMQSTSAMGRFETQLSELREMLAEQLNLKHKIESKPPENSLGTPSSQTSKGKSSSGGSSSWDEMKARLLGETDSHAPVSDSGAEMIPGAESSSEGESIPAGGDSDESAPDSDSAFTVEIRERPETVENIEEADADTLRSAVTARDEHIDHLMNVIQQLKEQGGMAELEAAKQRQSELEEKLRKAEIEMSMERAKLAREETRLKQMEEEINNPKQRKNTDEAPKEGGEEKGNRWVKFLGSKE